MNRSFPIILPIVLTLYGMSTLVAMAPMNIGAGAALLVIIALAFMRKDFRPFLKPHKNELLYLALSAGFVLVAAMSLWVARTYPLQFSGRTAEIEFAKDLSKLWYLFLPFFIAGALSALSHSQKQNVRWGMYFAFTVLSIVGVAQFFTGWPRPQPIPGFEPYFHATLGLGHHLSVASIWIFPFFALLEEWSAGKFYGPWKGLFGIGILAGAATLFLTFSRMGWVAVTVSLLFWIFWRVTHDWKKSRKIAAVLAVLIAGGAILQIPPIQRRLSSGIGIQERMDLWQTNLEFVKLRPWSGIGFRQTEELAAYYLQEKKGVSDVFTGHAHNNLLEVLSGTGIFGGILWFLTQALIFTLIWKLPIQWRRPFFCAFLAFQINGLTQVNYWEGKVQHQLAWMIAWVFVFLRMSTDPEKANG